jgi:ribosomal protein S6
MDDLDHKHLVQTHAKVDLLNEQVARLQERLDKVLKSRTNPSHAWGRKYLRKMLKEKREVIAQQKLYIVQLENELRLRGLE